MSRITGDCYNGLMGALFTARIEDANTVFGAYKISFALCLTFLEASNKLMRIFFFPSPITSEYQQRFSIHCVASAGNTRIKMKIRSI